MEKITSHHQVVGLMEAYNAVHTPQINEDQVWEEVESWVNSLVEEGYDLSEYTWEDMYESYLTERYNPANYGTTTKNGVTLYGPNDPKRFSSVTSSRFDRPRNAGTPQYVGGGGRTGIPVRYTRPQIGGLPANYRGQELQQTARARASQVGTPRQGTAGGSTTGGNTPSPTRPAAATARPVAPAARPAATTPSTAPKPTTPKPVGSAMDQWAAANPKLAAAKAERDRTRGTSATTNPLMKDMKSSMPAPKSPAPSTASTGFGLAKKGVNLAAGVDIFDLVKGHLLDEGYADSEEGAMIIMVNMSEEWRKSILEAHGVELQLSEVLDTPEKANEYGKKVVKSALGAAAKAVLTKDKKHLKTLDKRIEGAKMAKRKAEKKVKEEQNEEYVNEAQEARENPEGHDKEEKKKYEPVRGEKTPMPPRGDKRREEFEKWYRANVR